MLRDRQDGHGSCPQRTLPTALHTLEAGPSGRRFYICLLANVVKIMVKCKKEGFSVEQLLSTETNNWFWTELRCSHLCCYAIVIGGTGAAL